MPDIKLEIIRLRAFDDDRNEETLAVTFVEYSGAHTFVLGDEDAAWTINTTQACDNNTECVIKSGTETVRIKPLLLTWLVNTAFKVFEINKGEYKIEFSRS